MQQPERYNNTIQTAHLVSQSIGNNDNIYYDKEVCVTIERTYEFSSLKLKLSFRNTAASESNQRRHLSTTKLR